MIFCTKLIKEGKFSDGFNGVMHLSFYQQGEYNVIEERYRGTREVYKARIPKYNMNFDRFRDLMCFNESESDKKRKYAKWLFFNGFSGRISEEMGDTLIRYRRMFSDIRN